MGPAVTSDIFSGPDVRTLKLTHATANQSPSASRVAQAIDVEDVPYIESGQFNIS